MAVTELIVPWESRCEKVFVRQPAKYSQLINKDWRRKGWETLLFSVQVDTGGFQEDVNRIRRGSRRRLQVGCGYGDKNVIFETLNDVLVPSLGC